MVTDISIKQMPSFKRVYKKLHTAHREIVNKAIVAIVNRGVYRIPSKVPVQKLHIHFC